MAEFQNIVVKMEEAGIRLDKWFHQRYPQVTQGLIQKHIRKGFIRLNEKKTQAEQVLQFGDIVRIHPVVLDEAGRHQAANESEAGEKKKNKKELTAEDIKFLQSLVIYKDEDIIGINKPSGLAVQGGTGITTCLDDMLDALTFDAKERPRLVHRLDKDTSGVLLLARHRKAAADLTQAFRDKDVEKLYWAAVVGRPKLFEGKIDLPLSKKATDGTGEQMVPDPSGQNAVTYYKVLDYVAKRISWLALMPLTGRTHQLRVHCASIQTPILGDGKYGGANAFISGMSNALHLHARSLVIPGYKGKKLEIQAPLPEHMQETWSKLGFMEGRKKTEFYSEE